MINCEKYKATIPEGTCIARQKLLKNNEIHKFNVAFAGCRDCEIGLKLLKERKTMEEKKCQTCKKTYPSTKAYFGYAPRAYDGLTNDCLACRAKAKGDPAPDIHVEKPLVTTAPAPTAKKKAKLKPSAERKILSINIESVPELWSALAERAEDEMRTPVAQALWILRDELL